MAFGRWSIPLNPNITKTASKHLCRSISWRGSLVYLTYFTLVYEVSFVSLRSFVRTMLPASLRQWLWISGEFPNMISRPFERRLFAMRNKRRIGRYARA